MAFNTAVIRELLSRGFNDEELRTLSYDHFRPVYEEFTTGMTKGEMIQLLLDYAGRRDEITSLLDAVRQANPTQYTLYADRLTSPDLPASAAPEHTTSRVARDGLLALVTMLQAPDAHSAVVAFQTDFQASREYLDVLVNCKRLHDLFQQLEDRCRLIDLDRRRLPGDESAWESLTVNAPEVDSIIGDLLASADRSAPATEDTWWADQVSRARGDLQSAVDDSALPQLRAATNRLSRVLGREPSRINTRLVATADALRLAPIVAAITAVLEGVPQSSITPDLAQALVRSREALQRLDRDLRGLVSRHNAWQAIDDELHRIENNLALDIVELEISWPDLKAMTATTGDAADVIAALQAVGIDLEAALATGDPARARRLFQRFRSQASRRFNQVDHNLLNLCEELRLTGEPLDLLLRALR